MIQIDETTWNKVTGAVVAWRKAYDNDAHNGVASSPATAELMEASELILHPPKPVTVRELHENMKQYAGGPHHSRILMEYRARRLKEAVTFLEFDLNDGQPSDRHVRIDPSSVKEDPQGVIQYKLMPEAPASPKTFYEAVEFLHRQGHLYFNREANASSVRTAVLTAATRGFFKQANQAALLIAREFKWDVSEVNPYSENSDAPWTDVIDGAMMPQLWGA